MEQSVPELMARLDSLEASLSMATTINSEVFYWWCTALMLAIHAGFLAYEMGASRAKNALASGMKNLIAFAFLIPAFYYIGWWIYLAFPTGFTISDGSEAGLPWSEYMGPNLTDNASGIFYAAFTLFAATTASIMSGSVIERIRISGFTILALFLGAVVWVFGASWGWHPDGWLTTEWGLHDVGAAGAVHTIAGFFTLGVLINLGPRIGRFNADGTVNNIDGHNMPMSLIGLMLIVMGFFGFLGGCIIYTGDTWMTIYNTPATLSAFAFNTLMGVAGGMIGAYLVTRDPFWMMSGALIGVISSAPALDLYYPGLVMAGIFASGYQNVAGPEISFVGQLSSAVVFMILGFAPGYVLSLVLKLVGLLRVSEQAEVAGLDKAEVPVRAYPESTVPAAFTNDPTSPTPAE